MTPREIQIWADGQNERDLELYRSELYVSWLNAKLVRVEASKFPPLADVLPKPKMTAAERAEVIRERMANFAALRNRTVRRQEKAKAKHG